MSTSVAEKPKTEPAPEAEKPKWTMPRVRNGQQVLFFRHGERLDPREHPPEIAFVRKSGANSITQLQTIDGWPAQGVLHIDDPRMQNPDMKANGAWDFIEDEKAQKALNAKLSADIATLTELNVALAARVTALEEASKKK